MSALKLKDIVPSISFPVARIDLDNTPIDFSLKDYKKKQIKRIMSLSHAEVCVYTEYV